MSVKGEQGGSGDGWGRWGEGGGEKREHVSLREGGRCACRGWSLASGSSLGLPFSPALSSPDSREGTSAVISLLSASIS